MKRLFVAAVFLPLFAAGGLAVAAAGVAGAVGQALGAGPGVSRPGSIPAPMLRLYRAAASTCPGLSWTVLAAVGTVESDNGAAPLPGVRSGHNRAGAEGPMQFEPATFARYDRPVPSGGADPPSPYDPVDAVYAASRMLCADRAGEPGHLGSALFDYNHSTAYVAEVIGVARSLGLAAPGPGDPGRVAVDYALAQVGTPYRWGGEAPGVGFDCSGLSQAAWAAAGVAIPRVAEAQFAAGPRVPPGVALSPGDLVFFGPRAGDATHVGLVVAPSGLMVDAPHTGASVRVEAFPVRVGSRWGSDLYLGATAPGG